ncbi:MAG TPA: alkaline phosphatase family protein [Methylomirabilota bacterium]|jgi:phospholipase C|nr:alkaline phosphatase family protein [Methylomirabilota bacterium]
MLTRWTRAVGLAALAALVLLGCAERGTAPASRPDRAPIDHIIVLFQENRTFDHYFGHFPGADGLANVRVPQTDKAGKPYEVLPPPLAHDRKGPEARFRAPLPNAPFDLGRIIPPEEPTADPAHQFFRMQRQYGPERKMDRWVAETDVGGLIMGYYGREANPVQWKLAEEFVLFDRWFQAIHGSSNTNHYYLIAARTAVYPNAPPDLPEEVVDKQGNIVGTIQPWYEPHLPNVPDARRAPPQTFPTIGDRLSAAGVTWAWYHEGWAGGNPTVRGNAGYIPHHNPFVYFKQVMENPAMLAHLQDLSDFHRALAERTLPRVAFVKANGPHNGHGGYSTVTAGDRWVGETVSAIMRSAYWPRVAIVLTYDEGGGWFDHVSPPVVDYFGPGSRVPALVISPYAKRGYLARGTYDHTSILKLIEWRFGLEPLTDRDRGALAPLEAFDFAQAPRPPLPLP